MAYKKRSIGDYTKKGAAEWRALHIGFIALLARKGVGTTNKKGLHIPYEFGPEQRYAKWYKEQKKNYWRIGVDHEKSAMWSSEDPEYMKLRNYSFSVFNEEWHGERPGETGPQRAVRALWSSTKGGGAGTRMINYLIDGLNKTVAGAKSLMQSQGDDYAQKGQGNARIKLLEKRMTRSLINFIQSSNVPQTTVKGTKFWTPSQATPLAGGMGMTGMSSIKKGAGGIPVINAHSPEEAKLFLASTYATNYIPDVGVEQQLDVESALLHYKQLNKIRPQGQKLDLVPGKNDEAFEAAMKVLDKNAIEWTVAQQRVAGPDMERISGMEVGMQDLDVRLRDEWAAFQKKQKITGRMKLKHVESFIEFSANEYSDTQKKPSYKHRRGFFYHMGKERTRQIRENVTAGVPEDLREEPFLVTQKFMGESRILIPVRTIKGEMFFGPIGYIPDFKGDMGDAVIRSLIADGNYAETVIKNLDQYSKSEFYRFEGLKMSLTYNFYGNSANLMADAPQFQSTVVVPPKLARALYAEIVDGPGGLRDWADQGGLDNILTGGTYSKKGKFMLWFSRWMQEGERVAQVIDEATGQGSWKSWLLRKARPMWRRGMGGRMPKALSGLTQPWEKAPRTWHPPLYVKPFARMDKEGIGKAYTAERARILQRG